MRTLEGRGQAARAPRAAGRRDHRPRRAKCSSLSTSPVRIRAAGCVDDARRQVHGDRGRTEGRPYRDFPVEYPPVSLAAIEAAAGPNGNETGARPGLAHPHHLRPSPRSPRSRSAGARVTAVAYPFLTAPLLGFLYTTIDLIAVALAVGAVALRGPGRDRLGAAWRSGAPPSWPKVWPARPACRCCSWSRKRRAPSVPGAALTLGTFVWVWWGGASGLAQVATQRQTRDGSTRVRWARSSGPSDATSLIINDSDTGRRRASGAPKALLLGAALVGIAAVWYRASRRQPRSSASRRWRRCRSSCCRRRRCRPRYMIWLAPWAAIAPGWSGRVRAVAAGLR